MRDWSGLRTLFLSVRLSEIDVAGGPCDGVEVRFLSIDR